MTTRQTQAIMRKSLITIGLAGRKPRNHSRAHGLRRVCAGHLEPIIEAVSS
jgi:hypothetical protein